MHELTDVLMAATAHIGQEYFRLPVHGGGAGLSRACLLL